MIEQNIKNLLGEYAFTVAALQAQVQQLQDKVKEYEDKPKRSKSD